MHRTRIAALLAAAFLLAALALALAGCAASKAPHKPDPAEGINPSALATDVFTLTDQRDMGYAMVKLEKEGYLTEELVETSRQLTVDHVLAMLRQQSAQAEVTQSSPAGWIIEARELFLGDNAFSSAALVIRRERVKVHGKSVSMAKLQRLILDGEESTEAFAWALYRDVLRLAVQN